ncbi:hydantoinase B/oxoprolinase family protein [Sphingomonas sp. SUN039]|uniref:hydantoinase B/oxoprolinase family protein n=1 Tax=Sphingomonas sp. SUN039 TaxID=2937787 RepID=UPI002164EEEE|nr:hydantoinase B/oxoprolinase family protein [Sphingomonas sp. SUN039]UVO55657.1 hydantoinase B/oxoprolinase family protein [Sphingomonas sp. SUN039]
MLPDPDSRWSFWIDRGGTFTDVIARTPGGEMRVAKLLSVDPERYDDAAVAAIRELTATPGGPLPPLDIRIGTTIATNALLERTGEPVLLAITRGFGDALIIGTQDRPDIFARHIVRAAPLFADVVEIDERVTHEGEVLVPLDAAAARTALSAAYARGLRAIAIVLMHGYCHTAHEAALAEIAASIGFTQISVSHRIGALAKLVGRGDTSVVDAYLSPVLRRYVEGLSAALGEADPLFMKSDGGLAPGTHFHGKDAILSGPAGGIVGMAQTSARAGFDRVIGFDMGGTSTDVSLYDGHYERDNDNIVAGVRIRAPMLRIHTVAAGGGSICRYEDGRLAVGPASAGADPGPACYRRGGPLTITDCNVVLGKVQARHFPNVFGPNRNEPLDVDAAFARLQDVADAMGGGSVEDIAESFIAIAVADMAGAIRAISIARGHDVARFALTCFGGAGGQHACLVADTLGIGAVLIHPLAGVLSAYGMGLADRRELRERTLGMPLDGATLAGIEREASALGEEARDALIAQGLDADSITIEATALVRTQGSDSSFEIALGPVAAMTTGFTAAFRQRFGYADTGPLVVDMLRAEAVAAGANHTDLAELVEAPFSSSSESKEEEPFDKLREVGVQRVFDRSGLAIGATVPGPALIVDPVATTMVEPGWNATVDPDGVLILKRTAARAVAMIGTARDPARLEIFAGLFMGIAEDMGAALRHSASSVNIRERLDFSCAVFAGDGALIANAPHIPVHLGSMGESIRTILRRRTDDGRGIRSGDVYALNAPYDGGTHLPDITVIQPVFADDDKAAPAFFVAARGHHADIGGISPGSMPPGSTTLAEEGVVFDNVLLVEDGQLREAETRVVLASGPYPARNIDMNIADLAAQVAACARGSSGLLDACALYSTPVVLAYMSHVQDHAEEVVRRLISTLSSGSFAYELDDGSVVQVAVTVGSDATLDVDFTGTSPQQPGNFNAPVAVVRAAVLYALRTLTDTPVPLNDGFLRPVTIRVPAGSMLNPRPDAAVVAGNVETSQVVTDALFGALGALAGSQGTMNNFTFGNAAHQYYETIAGGSGAGPGFGGTDAVQTHMTNSRLTDPEILEARFPVLVERFAIRTGSGGAGAHKGGNGVVRRIRFREAMDAGILSNRRRVPPFGLEGGAPGAPGINGVERTDGTIETLGATASVKMSPGDVFVIETPGGGGFGSDL